MTVPPPAPVRAFSDVRHLKRWGLLVLLPIAGLAIAVPLVLLALGAGDRAALLTGFGLAGLLVGVALVILLGTHLPAAH